MNELPGEERKLVCDAPGCGRPATHGESWKLPPLKPLQNHRLGVELSLQVRDLAATLTLCDEHADELMSAAWTAAQAQLDEWGWSPLR